MMDKLYLVARIADTRVALRSRAINSVVTVGTPNLAGAVVTATIRSHGRLDKVRIVKFRRRKHHRKQMGHRQYFTEIEITGIAG